MRHNVKLYIFLAITLFALIFKSPFASMYNYKKALNLYKNGQYEKSLTYFERSFFANANDTIKRQDYVEALAKSKPTYSVQKKLYEMSKSQINDNAKKIANTRVQQTKNALLRGISDNYIQNAVSGSDIIRWNIKSFPLNVYIQDCSDIPSYYRSNIISAMNQWATRTTFVRFNIVKNENQAQIIIKFKDIGKNNCTTTDCKYVIAYTEPQISNNNLKSMTLTFYKTNPLGKALKPQEIYSTTLHETGHTLGIMGHSQNPSDIMFATKDSNAHKRSIFGDLRLSKRDLNTLVLLYRTMPTITNSNDFNKESMYYPPLVIGSSQELMDKKITELKQYIKDYPNIATGYINLGGAYADMGNFESALHYMQLAEKYSKNNDENYLIAYNKAILYYNKQEKNKALQYAKQAQSIKNDASIQELITDINNL